METYLVTASSLNLRSAPKMADNIIGSLKRGSSVELLGKSDDELWMNVQRGTKAGWAFAKYLTKEADSDPIVEVEEFPWMPIALSQQGTKEVPGNGNNSRIVEYLKSTDLDTVSASKDSTPWCSGFVNWCVEKAGFAGSNSAWARSWLNWGRSVSRAAQGVHCRVQQGHWGPRGVLRGLGGLGVSLGGNQSDGVCIAGYPKGRLLGFRVPA
jgi:uncharacterized protein (TIGR02594 family)